MGCWGLQFPPLPPEGLSKSSAGWSPTECSHRSATDSATAIISSIPDSQPVARGQGTEMQKPRHWSCAGRDLFCR